MALATGAAAKSVELTAAAVAATTAAAGAASNTVSSTGQRTGPNSRTAAAHPSSAGSGQGATDSRSPGPSGREPEVQDIKESNNNSTATIANQEPLFLLTCISIGRYATSLVQLDLQQPAPIVSDRQLLDLLRARYRQMRHSWRRALLSFRTLTSIDFVQFELHRRSLVDIRKRNDIPPAERHAEYRYLPVPAEVIPPVGKNYLMHIYNHPEDADEETVCLTRFPKRVRETLKLGGEAGVPIGWGIEFVEGVHWNKVCCFGFAIVAVSLVTAVTWSCWRRDVQGGFNIAGYMMALLTFMVGMLQTAGV